MSLYSLATDLFADIDKVRAAASDPIVSAKKQRPRLVDDEPGDRLHVITSSEVGLPQLRDRRQNGKTVQPSTLELLEGCLHDIHEIRCGTRSAPMTETKHSCEGQRCHDDDSDRTSSSSCSSETSRTGGELIDQADNAEGDTGSTLDTASVGRVCVIDKGDNKKAAIDSFVGVLPAELGSSSGGGDAGAGPTTTTRTSTIVREKGVEKPCCIDTDAAATESYADFEREITEWSTSARVGGVQRVRTDMAAHLSEKYLCRKLDAMPSSAVVCHLRRKIVRRIDLLASGAVNPRVDGEAHKLITRGSQSGHNNLHNNLVVSGDRDHQGVDHRIDGSVPPLLANGLENPAFLSNRVAPYRGPSANRVSVDNVDVDPTRHVLGRSIKCGQKNPGMKGAGPAGNNSSGESSRIPAPSSGDLYPTAITLPVSGLEARERIKGEVPSSCLKRVARHFPPVRLDKGSVFSSNLTGGPRGRAVRFLLGADDNESPPSSAGMAIGSPAQVETAQVEADTRGNVERLWICVVCGKPNVEDGGSSCTICGRRQRGRCIAKAGLGVGEEGQYPVVIKGKPNSVKLQQSRPENRPEGVRLAVSGGHNVRSDRQTGACLGGASGIGGVRDTARKFGRPYDASLFAKMRRETEPALRARLGLTGEIKSLLSAIRRNG